MNRDVGYALIAALTLTALASLWVLFNAASLADPDDATRVRGSSGSVPVRPRPVDNAKAIEKAVAVLGTRDLFEAAAPADMAALDRLARARISPPVELVPVTPERDEPAAGIQTFLPPPPPAAPVARPEDLRQAENLASTPSPAPQAAPPRPAAPAPSSQAAVTVSDPRFPLTLRGVFPDPSTGGRAHLALPDGRVVMARPGVMVEGFFVVRINPASIVVQGRGGPPIRLEMPGY